MQRGVGPMQGLFSQDYWLLWALALAIALFFPVRQLIWVVSVRRADKRQPTDEAERARLKRRAGVTAGLMSLIFSVFYTFQFFSPNP